MYKLCVSHPTGNQNLRELLKGLRENDALSMFNTCIATYQDNSFGFLSRLKPFKQFERRRFDENLRDITSLYPWYEVARNLANKYNLHLLTKHNGGFFSTEKVYWTLDRRVARKLKGHKHQFDAVYAYEDGAYKTFQIAKSLNKICFYELPIGYWRAAHKIMHDEREKNPEWAKTIMGFQDSTEKLQKKDYELKMADYVFVASSFTKNSLSCYPENIINKISVVPYGFPPAFVNRKFSESGTRKLRALFVGGLSQRKGLSYLFEAMKTFDNLIELTIVGKPVVNDCKILNTELAKHNWIPSLHHSSVLQLMRNSDILIFPSLFEGFGLVITEAMAQGTPVITTDRTIGPDFITHGQNGWIINAGSTEALVNCLDKILRNRKTIEECGRGAIETANQRSWRHYSQDMLDSIIKKIECNG